MTRTVVRAAALGAGVAVALAVAPAGRAEPLAAAAPAATPAPSPPARPAAPATVPGPRAAAPYAAGPDTTAPWPSMRHDARNTGATALPGRYARDAPWTFRTGRGVFATAAVAADGTTYVGSADHVLYALGAAGKTRWTFPTGGIIDSAPALLAADPAHPKDGAGLVIGSGDTTLYRLRTAPKLTAKQRVVWRFHPTLPTSTDQLVAWWEGSPNVGPDGTVYDGNTGGGAYAVHPDGTQRWAFETGNSVWTAPAVAADGTTYWGSLDAAVRAIDSTGALRWKRTTLGFVTSSPALSADGSTLYVGSFDGRLYALDAATGVVRWSYATADHIYASPALVEDSAGAVQSIVIASTDGTVDAVGPDGTLQWSYDTGSPVRSSPVVGRTPDGAGRVAYVGSSDGRLYALDATPGSAAAGTLRWAYDTTSTDPALAVRHQLNSAPALGRYGVVIGSQDGTVWYVPYDWCKQPVAHDKRCSAGVALPADGVAVYPVDTAGDPVRTGIMTVAPTAQVSVRLVVRAHGATVPAQMVPVPDAASLVSITPAVPFTATLSGDGRTVFVRPVAALKPGAAYRIRVHGLYAQGAVRVGNVDIGARDAVPFDGTVQVRAATASAVPLFTSGPEAVTALSLSRMAVPQPAMMTSLNQIGFDFYDWVAGTVSSGHGKVVLWVVGARTVAGVPVADPSAHFSFPLSGRLDRSGFRWDSPGASLTFTFGDVPLQQFSLRGRFDTLGRVMPDAQMVAQARCGDVPGYGARLPLTGMCNAEGLLPAEGTFLGRTVDTPAAQVPGGVAADQVGLVPAAPSADGVAITTLRYAPGTTYSAREHVAGILLLDRATGDPVPLDYAALTTQTPDAAGNLGEVQLRLPAGTVLPSQVEAVVMTDVFALSRTDLKVPAPAPAQPAWQSAGGYLVALLAIGLVWLAAGLLPVWSRRRRARRPAQSTSSA